MSILLLNLSRILRRSNCLPSLRAPSPQSHISNIYLPFSMTTAPGPEWRRVATPPFFMFDKPIQTSEQDDRQYRIIQLQNGLQATLVHDPTADSAAASLDVAVGHLSDPIDMPGLAHFCEHLLFMGTEQFPRENEYSEYLAKNNGRSNAYTSTTNTNYYFNVATPALSGALERFAAFFHCPLFAPSCTSRELNAVDSEHKKNHQADLWRIFQVTKHLSREGHVWSKFGSGNRESLLKAAKDLKAGGLLDVNGYAAPSRSNSLPSSSVPSRIPSPAPSLASNNSELDDDGGSVGRETRRRLVEWWSKEYCASRMRLCIIGKDSLDRLAELTSVLFSPIPNRGQDPLPMIYDHPFGPQDQCALVSIQTIMSFHSLDISIPLEYQPPYWKHKPAGFISHLVGHEGPGSLCSYLKNKGWITSIRSETQDLGRGFAIFRITFQLTREGFMDYRTVVLASFKYLALLRSSDFPAYHQRELAILSSTRFRFQEKKRPDDYAKWIANTMTWPVPREYLLSAPILTWDWDHVSGQSKIREYLESFRITEARVVLMAQADEHAKLDTTTPWNKEPWYGTEYRVRHFDKEFIEQAQGPNDIPELALPGPNAFIPTNVNIDKRSVIEPSKRPHLIRETPLSTLWHKKDDRFWVPKAQVTIDLRSPIAKQSSRAYVMTRLYSDVVNDSLAEFSYDAELAGLVYKLHQHSNGLYVTMRGYNDKMSILATTIMDRLKAVVVDPQRLAIIKEKARRDWQNFFLGQSYTLSDYFGTYAFTDQLWSLEENLKELPSITDVEIQTHMREFLSQVNLRILVTGNMYKDEAIQLAEIAEAGLGVCPCPSVELNDRALILPEASNFVWSAPIPNPNQANSALTFYVHFGPVVDQQLRVVSSLLTQILTEPAFNVLRTQEQLGYIVSCSPWLLPGGSEKGLRIVVQSEKNPGYLEERVEAFLDRMKNVIDNMSDEAFAEQKNGLEKKWLEVDKNLADEHSRFAAQINSGHWDFLRHENDVMLLKTVTKDDVFALFLTHVHPSSPSRSKLSVQMRSQKPRPKKVSAAASRDFEALVRSAQLEVDEAKWKESLGDDGTPLLVDFLNYWKQVLSSTEGVSQVLDALPDLVERYPVEGEGEERLRSDVTYIQDLSVFKGNLTPSVDPGPMAHWGDLPVSRF